VGEPLTHEGRVNWAGFSPDGLRVLTVSVDGTAGLWDALTGFRLSTGLKHRALVEHGQFSPDGRRIATASFDYQARIWEIARADQPAPPWLPELAEAVAGERLSPQGVPMEVPAGQFLELKSRLESLPADDAYTRWAQWFLGDRSTRPVAPTARHSARDFVAGLTGRWLTWGFFPSWLEAAKLEPTNGLVFAGIAWNQLDAGYTDPARVRMMDWHSQRALELAPDQPIVWRTRARALERSGQTNAALAMFERGHALREPYYWSEWAGALERAGRITEAWQKWEAILTMLEAQPPRPEAYPQGFGRYGKEFLRRHESVLGPSLPQGFDRWRALLGIQPRDSSCPAASIDLTPFYSSGLDKPWLALETRRLTLGNLPHGRAKLAGVEFDVRGVLQLSSAVLAEVQPVFCERASGIPLRKRARRLHVLHATDAPETAGKLVANYVVHYADGQQQDIPLNYGRDILAWLEEGAPTTGTGPQIAWRDSTIEEIRLQVCQFTWENPRPDAEIATLDFVSQMTQAAPFLVAITAEP
jgi:hypothetical protein